MAWRTFRIPYRRESVSPQAALILEQQPWDAMVGHVSRLDLVREIWRTTYDDDEGAEVDCGLVDGCFDTLILAWPSPPTLAFRLGVTHGTLGEPRVVEVTVRELVSFSLTRTAQARYPIQALVSASWLAECYDADGNEVAAPTITVDGQQLQLPGALYGTAELRYLAICHQYGLNVPPREESVENVYQAVVWGQYDGGVELLEVDPPDGAEEDYHDEWDCRTRGKLQLPPDDQPEPPTTDGEDHTVYIDYCSQTVLS